MRQKHTTSTASVDASNLFSSFASHLAMRATAVLLAALLPAVASQAADPIPADLFPVGVYWQPTYSFDLWKSRGINTVIGFYDKPADMEAFNQAAVSRGLWMIRNPRANPADDKNQKYLLAWSHADEPDINGVAVATLAANYAKWKAADPTRPVITNFSGQNAMYQLDGLTDKLYQEYIKSTDWVANDVYPVTAWNHADWIDKNTKYNASDASNNFGLPFTPGNSVDKLRALSNGKKQFAYIETSFQNLGTGPSAGARSATAAEVRGETWDAIIHGAKGIIYFPQSFHPDTSDGTPKDVAAEMTKTDATIARYAAVINSDSDAGSNPMTLTGSLEGSWRIYQGKVYYFVLNFSHTATNGAHVALNGIGGLGVDVADESRSLLLNAGTITDNFAPYQLHIYETAGSNLSSLAVSAAVPEPACGGLLLLATVGLLRRRRV